MQKPQETQAISKLAKLESIIASYHDRLEGISSILCAELNLSSAQKLQEELAAINDTERLMKIGIVGRVKAGKSSLINAIIFDGENILPKAATPMTAALTEISYAESYALEVEYFTANDIANIKKEADEYDRRFAELLAAKKSKPTNKLTQMIASDDKLIRQVQRELQNTTLASSKEQYEMIKSSSLAIEELTESRVEFGSLKELQSTLGEFVGAHGKYMPFTKSVKIKLPIPSLKDIEIIDTPGVNDPVISREQRTRDILNLCDVIFIVSPSGQFMSREDLDLMDRITRKSGIRELFAIASKSDTQIVEGSSIYVESNGILATAMQSLESSLSALLRKTLSDLKQSNPEVGDAYDSLINDSEKSLICSAGLAFAIKNKLDDMSSLDEAERHALGLLQKAYPDNFPSENKQVLETNLNLISSIESIKSRLESTAKKKLTIMEQKVEEFHKAKDKVLADYTQKLIESLQEQEKEIKTTDIQDLQTKSKKLEKVKSSAISSVDDAYDDIAKEFVHELKTTLMAKTDAYFKEVKKTMEDSEDTETTSYQVSDSSWYNPWSWGKKKTVYETEVVVRAGAVTSSIMELIKSAESTLNEGIEGEIISFRKQLQQRLIRALREGVERGGGSDDDIDIAGFKKAIKNVITRIAIPDISYADKTPPMKSSTLRGYEAERFIDEAREFVMTLDNEIRKDIRAFGDVLDDTLNTFEAEEIFSAYNEQITQLESDIANQAQSLEEIATIISKLKGV